MKAQFDIDIEYERFNVSCDRMFNGALLFKGAVNGEPVKMRYFQYSYNLALYKFLIHCRKVESEQFINKPTK